MRTHPAAISIIVLLLIIPAIPATTATPKTILYVDDDNTQGPWDGSPQHPYQHITDAITNATDNDTIYILTGTYHERLQIPKPLHLQGQEKNTTIVTADGTGTIATITADHVALTNLTFQNSAARTATAAIDIRADHTTITACNIYRNRIGITITGRTDLTVTNCMIHTNQQGIHTMESDHITIDHTSCYRNGIGIVLRNSTTITLNTTHLHTNSIGCMATHDSHLHVTTSAFCDNNDNQGGLFLFNTTDITVDNSIFTNNGLGVWIKSSTTLAFTHTTFDKNTHNALNLFNTTALTITNCSFTNNLRYAINAQASSLNLTKNLLDNDTLYGLYATDTTADARTNWWGSPLGPTHTSYSRRADRCTQARHIQYTPWLLKTPTQTGATWEVDSVFTTPEHPDAYKPTLVPPGGDTDGDGAPDWWETKWGYDPLVPDDHAHLDPDGDGLTNLQECFTDSMNSNPFHKDVYLEFDWLTPLDANVSNKIPTRYLNKFIAAFAEHNITLHIDTGQLGGGEELPGNARLTYEDVLDRYWDDFLNGDLDNPRKGVFHYGLFCDQTEYGGFAFIGWDNLDSFVIGCQQLKMKHPGFSRDWLMYTGAFHELGHSFDLIAAEFGGIDNSGSVKIRERGFWEYHNYRSCMNYFYTYLIPDYSDGSHGRNDQNDWALLNLSFFKDTAFSLPG